MKRITVFLLALAALLLTTALPAGRTVEGATQGALLPLLATCSDVNGSGGVDTADIAKVVSVFGTTPSMANYRLLFNVWGGGNVDTQDISATVADFGDTNAAGTCAVTDTQIAVATRAIMDSGFSHVLCGGNCGGDIAFLTESASFLLSRGYVLASANVPGQGKHYISPANSDGVFNPARPEGLVYDNGKLAAQLYVVDGDVVGWGPEPQGTDNIQIDAFCTPGCSFAGPYDGWHVHSNLCTYAIGSTNPSHAITSTAAGCQAIHDAACSGSKCVGTTWSWEPRVGWMGHLWNHTGNANTNPLDINSNGRFADCYPDPPGNWKGFNCPGMGM